MKFFIRLALFTVGVSLIAQYIIQNNNTNREGVCPFDKNVCYFTKGYYQARSQFREKVNLLGAEIISQEIPNNKNINDITIDVAVFRNNQSKNQKSLKGKTMVHVSGTHGVEAYVGSAIQLAFLDKLVKKETTIPEDTNLVIIHSLNAFGHLFNRRFNENNVDLNRNMIGSQEEFDELKKTGGKGAEFYRPFEKLFNPDEPWVHPLSDIQYYLMAIYNLTVYGFFEIKQALVNGQYYYPEGLYFGGWEQQTSTKFLIDLFQNSLKINESSEIIMVDVHTGLGPEGIDTLMIDHNHKESVMQIFGKETEPNTKLGRDFFIDDGFATVSSSEDDKSKEQNMSRGTDATKGYEYLTGGLENIFKIANVKKGIFVTQEFGTVNGIFVLKGMTEENVAWRNGNQQQKALGAIASKNAFMVEKVSFKDNIISRGLLLINQALRAFQDEECMEDMPINNNNN